jgi:hypothetical protein
MQAPHRLTSAALAAVATLAVTVPAADAKPRPRGDHGTQGHHGPKGHGHKGHHAAKPSAIALPDGFGPESLTGSGSTLYAGSSTSGAVWAADARTGRGRVLVPAHEGRSAFGIAVAGKRLVVAGGTTGNVDVYDAATGADVATIALGGAVLNDVVVRGNVAYVTDTLAPVVYEVALDGSAPPRTLALTGYPFTEGQYAADGIAFDGDALLVGDISAAALYRIDPATGASTAIAIPGAALPANDGILRVGRRVYVAAGDGRLSVVDLPVGATSGRLISQRKLAPALTDVARAAGALWILDAAFQQTHDPSSKATVRRIR